MAAKTPPQSAISSDVIVSGAGLIGLSMALALARSGVSVQLVDRRSPDAIAQRASQQEGGDIRATAIIRSSWEMFCALGLEDVLAPSSQPINAIEVRDGVAGKPLRFAGEDGDAEEPGAMGQMVPNAVLASALFDALSCHELVTGHFGAAIAEQSEDAHCHRVRLDNGTQIEASLLIIAEGRQSSSRDAKGFVPTRWQYDHHAIVATIGHSLPHHGVAHELFFADGPLAMLPLPDVEPVTGVASDRHDHRSSLVWSLPADKAEGYGALSPRGFAAELGKILQPLFGDISPIGERVTYPLSFHVVNHPVRGRSVVIGDGAHALHPIAGQGFNLGLRDVACLAEIVAENVRMGLDCGDAGQLERYSNWRDGDVTMMAAATDGLTRIFGLSGKTASRIRQAGMAMVGGVPALRNIVASEARGEAGRLPRLLQGLEV
jgi:2-octaprenyl-6-methoxyphenol hydroxylase